MMRDPIPASTALFCVVCAVCICCNPPGAPAGGSVDVATAGSLADIDTAEAAIGLQADPSSSDLGNAGVDATAPSDPTTDALLQATADATDANATPSIDTETVPDGDGALDLGITPDTAPPKAKNPKFAGVQCVPPAPLDTTGCDCSQPFELQAKTPVCLEGTPYSLGGPNEAEPIVGISAVSLTEIPNVAGLVLAKIGIFQVAPNCLCSFPRSHSGSYLLDTETLEVCHLPMTVQEANAPAKFDMPMCKLMLDGTIAFGIQMGDVHVGFIGKYCDWYTGLTVYPEWLDYNQAMGSWPPGWTCPTDLIGITDFLYVWKGDGPKVPVPLPL